MHSKQPIATRCAAVLPLRRIGLLYAPVAFGLALDVLVGRVVSYNLVSRTGVGGISWMNYATTLIQFPQGLVATAVSKLMESPDP